MATFLVMGANRGIGLEITRQLCARGDTVVAACRQNSEALTTLSAEIIEGVDVTDEDSLRELDAALGGRSLDTLVHVAGILEGDSLATASLDSMRRHFEVNTLAPFAAVRQLHHRLVEGGKVFILSSRVGSIADNGSGGNYAYRVSKTAVNMVGANLAHDLKPRGISVILLHPGYVRTDMTGHRGHVDARESAEGLIERMDSLGIDDTGSFWHASGEQLTW